MGRNPPFENRPHVVLLSEDDLSDILALERSCFEKTWSLEQMRSSFKRGSLILLGAKNSEGLQGYVAFQIVDSDMELLNVAVLPAWRGQGLGRDLVRTAMQFGLEQGGENCWLEVAADNAPALSLYHHLGFTMTGVRKNYYKEDGRCADAVMMQKELRIPPDLLPQIGGKMSIRFLEHMDVKGKRLLIRVDYNVPMDQGAVREDTRIRASLPTLRKVLEQDAAVVLCSHMGSPKGQVVPELSLQPVAEHLAGLLGRPVAMALDCVGPEAEKMAQALQPGQVLLLENLRFHPGETKNDPEFSRRLARLGEVYVNDAFATAHRAHASVAGVVEHFTQCCAGLLMQKEWEYLGLALANPKRPYVAISGGAKVSTKLGILNNLLDNVDRLIIGGAMANTFIKAQGFSMGLSLVENELLDEARAVMDKAKEKGVTLYLPVDFVYASSPKASFAAGICAYQNVPAEQMVLDIGPATRTLFAEALTGSGTAVWNGPMGAFENPAFAQGSMAVAKAIAENAQVSIVGGGDTDAMLHAANMAGKVSFISTGGGAFLEFMEGKELPAFKALRKCAK